MNLWTVGCADPRLTAQARSPMDKPGKTPCVSPTLPTGRRLPTKFTALPQQDGMNLFRGNDQTSSRLPALSLFFPGGCPNNRHRRTFRAQQQNHGTQRTRTVPEYSKLSLSALFGTKNQG
jgi:hypothetical protein